jgi:integrase/recombinase XerD
MVTLKNWRERMSEDLRLRDLRPRTQEGYLLATRQFVEWAGAEPEVLTDEHVRRYFLYLREERKLAPSSINIAMYAVRFFCVHTLQRDWKVFEVLRVNVPRRLPVILSRPEVRVLLRAVQHPVRRMALTTIYALGFRLGEGLSLEAQDVDGQRLLASARDAKGSKDRAVPLPRPLLARLRQYWKGERPASATKYLFVAENGRAPLHETTLQKTFTAALRGTRIEKHATIHTLRHSYATHLLESGVSLRTIQQLLGHQSLSTTELYLHVTQPSVEHVQEIVDRLMAEL